MKPLSDTPLKGSPPKGVDKTALDDETPYITFLPPMNEGFHMGYKPAPGIQSDGNQKPGEWLENFAKYIRTQGEDVGYAIPDVLASEQQLRRLSRLPREMAMRHQEMADYRGVLSLLLLWDHLAVDEAAATLSLESLRAHPERGGFSQTVYAALSGERAAEGLQIFTLFRAQSENPVKTPLCLLSKAMVLMPAANLSDLSGLLPPCVSWYDRDAKRFNDPCPYLDEEMRSLLVSRLRFLQALNETPSARSLIYSPEAQLCALLEQFIGDVLAPREGWRSRLGAGDEAAENDLRTRVLLVYGLAKRGREGLSQRMLPTSSSFHRNNPLLHTLLPEGVTPPAAPAGEEALLYLLDGVPFARRSADFLLEPAQTAGETEALLTARQELALLDSFDDDWRRAMAQELNGLAQSVEGHTGAPCQLAVLLRRWRDEYLAYPQPGDWEITLRYPQDTAAPGLRPMLLQMLGKAADSCLRNPFSDCLLLIEGAESSPFGGSLGDRACQLQAEGDPLFFAPPLSPEMSAWLQAQGERAEPLRARLQADSLSCVPTEDGRSFEARFAIACRVKEGTVPGKITFVRVYPRRTSPEAGAAFALPAASLPCITLWPNARLSPERWRQYYVHAHRPEAVDLWALSSTGWVQGAYASAQDAGSRRQSRQRGWRTLCTDLFPAYLGLKRGMLSLGALVNDQPRLQLRRQEAAIAAVDFGSVATTVMLRQGDKVRPASLPPALHETLLASDPADGRYLAEEFIPAGAVTVGEPHEISYFSVMDMFSDEPEKWRRPLLDGHIYYPGSLNALLGKGESSLYYDLKWSEDGYVLRCLRLFLKQVMLQASLSARLGGSETLSWRVSMPSALPLHRQEAYLDMMRGLARELAQECGMPLTANCPPVLYAAENQADGLYFRSRNEVNARSGYLNMDVGGGTADLSLWLRNAVHATAECSLLLGCRQMLFASIEDGHCDAFEQDFIGSSAEAAAREIAQGAHRRDASARGRQKNMLLLDDFFAAHAAEISRVMAEARARGRVTYVESLLLFNIGFLFHLAGLLLERAYEDEELRPLLPQRMELCVAGNGGQLLKLFTPQQTDSLCRLTLAALCAAHPIRAILTVQSANPKQEAALGLLHDEGSLQSALQGIDRWNGTRPEKSGENEKPPELMAAYLLRFYHAFPQAANLLISGIYETSAPRSDARLTPLAKMELAAIMENEREKTPEDDFATWVRCFTGLKRLWKV